MQTTCYASCGNCEGKKIHNEKMKVNRFNSHTGLNPKVIRLIYLVTFKSPLTISNIAEGQDVAANPVTRSS